jgi:hypothetical protein
MITCIHIKYLGSTNKLNTTLAIQITRNKGYSCVNVELQVKNKVIYAFTLQALNKLLRT